MKRFALVAALVLAVTGGTARADVFAIVPAGPDTGVPFVLPSAEAPNAEGSLLLPLEWRERSADAAVDRLSGARGAVA